MMRRAVLLLALLFPLFAGAQPAPVAAIGDVIAIVPGFGSPFPFFFDNHGVFKAQTSSYCAATAAFDAAGHLVLGCAESIRVPREGTFFYREIFTGQRFRDTIRAIAPAPNGEIFALTVSSDVLEISADTTSVKRIAMPEIGFPVVNASIDLAPDGCTLYYLTHSAEIGRYDICTGTQLTKFLPNTGFVAFRVLGDGGVVASTLNGTLQFYDPAGRLFKTIVVSGSAVMSIAFDPDPAYVWTASAQYLAKIRISDGQAVVAVPFTADFIIVRGEQRPTTLGLTGAGRRRSARH